MLRQLKAELAKMENQYAIDDAIMEHVSMEMIKESYMGDYMPDYEDINIDELLDEDHELEMLEKVIEDIPEYTNESDMNIRVKRILEKYVPNFKTWEV
jgi:hypothetical protein